VTAAGRTQASTLAPAPALLAGIERLFERVLASLRTRLHASADPLAALDRHQIEAFECAQIKAELHAASAIVDYARACMATDAGAFEAAMAGAFVADILLKVRVRIERMRYSCGITARDVAQTFDAAEAFLAVHLDPTFIEATGQAVIERASNGRSLLDEDKQIIAASFARRTSCSHRPSASTAMI
jgi:hypothetical protein